MDTERWQCVCKKTVKQTKKVQETARQEDSPSAVGDKMIRKTVATVVDSSDEEDAAAAGERGESTQRRWNAREARCWRVGANVLSAEVAAHYAEVWRPYRVWVALRQRRIAAAAAKRWLRRRWTAEVRRWWTAVVDRGRPGRVRERTPEEARRVRRLRWLRAVSAEVRRVRRVGGPRQWVDLEDPDGMAAAAARREAATRRWWAAVVDNATGRRRAAVVDRVLEEGGMGGLREWLRAGQGTVEEVVDLG